jgi:hypothetical protein
MDYQEDTTPAGGGLWRYPDNVVVAGEADADDVNRLPAGMFNYSKYVRYVTVYYILPCIFWQYSSLYDGECTAGSIAPST